MSPLVLYVIAGAVLFVAGLHGLLVRAHLFWKVLAINVMASGNFLILIAVPPRLAPDVADPVPQAMVLTGIVVAVGSTALALGIALRVAARTGQPFLVEELRGGEGREWDDGGRGGKEPAPGRSGGGNGEG